MVSRQSQAVVCQAHAVQPAKPSRSAPTQRSASNHKMGNQAAQRLLRDGVIQAKLTVNQPGDRFEQEADRVAEQVMRMPYAGISSISHGQTQIQRMCAACSSGSGLCPKCAEEEKKQLLQRKEANERDPSGVPATVHEVIRAAGQPLDAATRAFMEPRFGHDFSRVRVHTEGQAAASARAVKALAYTVERDIVFAAGQYAPDTESGRRLLAHELTHVIQQGGGARHSDRLQRQDIEDVPAPARPAPTPAAQAPEFGPIIFDPACPQFPTRLGDLPPEPPCPESEEDIDGEAFRFCKDTDVFRDPDAPNRLVSFARNQPAHSTFKVFGYASKDGADSYNLNLSCHRAKRVARDLINAGVRPERIEVVAKGETERFSIGNTEARLAPNRVVIVRAEAPPAAPLQPGPLPANRRELVNLAIAKIERGEYRLAADAYISFWSCGRVPNLAEAMRRTRIEINEDPCPVIPGRTLGFPVRFNPNHPFSLNAIVLSADTFCAADPLECVLGRIIDMSFHHMVRQQIPNIDTQHAPALFLVELAGFAPCQTTDGRSFWNRVTQDPMQGQPDPACAAPELPGPLVTAQGQGRAPRQTPTFQVDQASVRGHRGAVRWRVLGDAGRMEPSVDAFELNAQVTLIGDRREFQNYEIGYIQTIIENDVAARYIAGQEVRTLLPVPLRDGPPARLNLGPPPWFDPRFIGAPDPATGTAATHMLDSPSRTAPLEFFAPNNVLDRMEQHVVFNNWLVARRRGAPLDRFSTFFLDGTLINFRQSADVVSGIGTGTFSADVDISTDETSMQLSGPTPGDIPQNLHISFVEPRPRASVGGLNFTEFARRVNQIAEPHRRSMGLLNIMTVRIRIVPETGRVILDTPTLAGGAITITTDQSGISPGQLQQLARAIFPEIRKLVLGPDPRVGTLANIPVVLRVLAP